MHYLKIDAKNNEGVIFRKIISTLLKEGIVVLPTDTIYGLSCLASSSRAIKRIYKLKERNSGKPLIVLVSSLAMLKKYAFISSDQHSILKKKWGGANQPTTVILRSRNNLAHELNGPDESLAARLPKSNFLIKIIKKIGAPLVSTSLNLSNRESLLDLRFLPHYFPREKYIDLVVDAGPCRRKKASRLVDLRQNQKPLILRY